MSLLGGLYIVLHKSQKFLEKPIVTVHDDMDIFMADGKENEEIEGKVPHIPSPNSISSASDEISNKE